MGKRSPRLQGFARAMRREPTRAESRLWFVLRARRFAGAKFRRQVPIAGYIVDFYSPSLRLVIEFDGSQHVQLDMRAYDDERTGVLIARGLTVVRISNELLIRDAAMVEQIIDHAIARCSKVKTRRE